MVAVNEQIFTYRKQLKSKLDPMRYEHSLSVSYTCMALAMRYGYEIGRAERSEEHTSELQSQR